MTRAELRDAVLLHAAFGVLAGLVLAGPLGGALGWRLLALVVVYTVALPLVALARGYGAWLRRWAFLVPLSVFMVVPDAVLASVLGTLDFPDTGGPRLWGVPLAMAGMWTVPLWITLTAADALAEPDRGRAPRSTRPGHPEGRRRGALVAALVAGALLVGSEATLWAVPIWRAVGVWTVAHVAVYVVLPEVALGAAVYLAEAWTRGRSAGVRIGAAVAVALLYLAMLLASVALLGGRAG